MENNKKPMLAPTAIVILGGTGDLAKTKLLPALFLLFRHGVLPRDFLILGMSRKELSHDAYREFVAACLLEEQSANPTLVSIFLEHIQYVAGDFTNDTGYDVVVERLQDFDNIRKVCTNKLFYLAVPPQYYGAIFNSLSRHGVMRLCDGLTSWSRILVEKPFGHDLKTAEALEAQLCELFRDDQIYRIDHYLAKDAIENIFSLRFANGVLQNSFNASEVESIVVESFETKTVAERGSFYDEVGALRDVGQNHLLQILAMLTIEPVDVRDACAVRDARASVLRSLTPAYDVRVGQYAGFLETNGVQPDSRTETYFTLKTGVDTLTWRGVPVTLRAGKALQQALSQAVVTFTAQDVCHCGGDEVGHEHKNILRIEFAPLQRITLTVWVKKPGFVFALEERELEFVREKSVDSYSPEAYERLLYDCFAGDQTRFVSSDEVLAAWEFITPLLKKEASGGPLPTYTPGSRREEVESALLRIDTQ